MDIKKTLVTLADWWPTKKQKENVLKVLDSGRLTYGPFTKELEEKFAKKHNFKYAIFTNSGTSALEIAWHYLKDKYNWPDGAEVLVPAVTFVATVNVLLHQRLKPVLVDIDPDTFNIDPELIEAKVTKKTVAICPVDLLGRPVDVEVFKIAKKYKLKVVEDSCETMFVSHSNGKPVGSMADLACYSSYLAHIISTGVGGFLCTNSKKEEEYLRGMIWHGRDSMYYYFDQHKTINKRIMQARFRFDKPGYSYRLTEMEAALGVDEVDRAEEIIEKRKENAYFLSDLLIDSTLTEYLSLPSLIEENAWMFFPIVCKDDIDRDKLCLFLEEKGIQTRYIMPLINQPVFKGMWNPKDYPVAGWLDKKGFLIGCHQFLTTEDLKYVAKVLSEFFKEKEGVF